MIAIKHPNHLMQEVPDNFVNADTNARQNIHQTYARDRSIFLIACKSQSISSYKLFWYEYFLTS